MGPGARLLLAFLLMAGAGLRFYRFDAPLWDRHAWKQTDLAGIARNWSEGDMNAMRPRIDWGGDGPGYAEMEFPLVPYLAAWMNRAFGEREAWGRLLNIASGMALALLLFAYLRWRVGPPAAFGALALASFSPLAWYYGRTYMQELTGWCLALGALLALDRALASGRSPSPGGVLAAGLLMALALLCKLNTAIVLLPMLAVALERRSWTALREPWAWAALVLALVPPLLWYLHAHGLYRQTGLTFGILGTGHDKFQTADYLSRFSWWKEIGLRVVRMLTTPPGLLLALAGLPALVRASGARPFLWWGVSAAAFTLVAAEGAWDMEYYQLALVVPAAATFGLGVAALWERRTTWARVAVVVLVAATLVMGARRGMAMTAPVFEKQYAAGQALGRLARPGDLVVNLGAYSHHQGGDDYEPNIFYYSRTRGWVLRDHEYRMSVVDSLRGRGARFAVTARLRELAPHDAFLDSLARGYRVVAGTDALRIWELETPRAPEPRSEP